MECYVCRDGTELVDGKDVCPKCGRKIKIKQKKVKLSKTVNRSKIPDFYINKVYSMVKLQGAKGDLGPRFTEYTESLERLKLWVSKNGKLPQSYFINSPKGFAKSVLGYTLLSLMGKKGNLVSSIKNSYEVAKDIRDGNYDYLIQEDLIIIKVQDIYTNHVFGTLEHILEVRSSCNKATIILSSKSISQLSNGEYTKILYMSNDNKLKYPNVIEYK